MEAEPHRCVAILTLLQHLAWPAVWMSDLVGKSLKNTSRHFLSCFALAYASPEMADASPEAQDTGDLLF